jgi:hypothetical protein
LDYRKNKKPINRFFLVRIVFGVTKHIAE